MRELVLGGSGKRGGEGGERGGKGRAEREERWEDVGSHCKMANGTIAGECMFGMTESTESAFFEKARWERAARRELRSGGEGWSALEKVSTIRFAISVKHAAIAPEAPIPVPSPAPPPPTNANANGSNERKTSETLFDNCSEAP